MDVRHILCSTRCADINLIPIDKHAILNLRTHKTTSLTIHRLRSKRSSNKVNSFALQSILDYLDLFLGRLRKLNHLEFDSSVLLWPNSLPTLPIMIHTWLTILGTVNCIPFAKFDLPELVQTIHLPSHKRVEKWISVSSNKTPSPVNRKTEIVTIVHCHGREEFEPVGRVGKFIYLVPGDPDRHHDLRLVLEGDEFCCDFPFFGFGFICCVGGDGRFFHGGCESDFFWSRHFLEIRTKLFHFSHQFISASLILACKTVAYLDRHPSAVKTKGKEDCLALHPLISSHKLNFRERESVSEMQ
jgi:hypothetical protein